MMPSAVSNRNNYNAAHHRRPSSQSQSSLPDQINSHNPQVQSPNRSLVFLPSTAYSQPATDFSMIERSRTEPSQLPNFENSPVDPRDFYRPYQAPFGSTPTQSFHQDALTTRTRGLDEEPASARRRKSSLASTQSQDTPSLRSPKGTGSGRKLSIVTTSLPTSANAGPTRTLNARKASFRDLVARFDTSPDDVPPLPPPPGSLSTSRKNSPIVPFNPHQNAFSAGRKNTYQGQQSLNNASGSKTTKPQHEPSRQQRPLFGEVLASGRTNIAGYGIVNARRRSGSEVSPMHSPNPMFPDPSRASLEPLPFEAAHPRYNGGSPISSAIATPPQHRRANSDLSHISTVSRIPRKMFGAAESPSTDSNHLNAKRISGSKIPVSTRRASLTSESAPSNSSSRAESKVGNYPPVASVKRTTPGSGQGQESKLRIKSRPAHHIQSPGKYKGSIAISQGEKSPSLRANIIAPAPKISPPLRGSRHRMPVSSASTAASRARMAEKFQAMAREQIDKKPNARPARPPELTDIDFNARRLKITQALSKSREEQDLRGRIARSQQDRDTRSSSTAPSESNAADQRYGETYSPEVPALVIQSPNVSNDGDFFETPTEEKAHDDSMFTQSALRALDHRQNHSAQDDSPTLGTEARHAYHNQMGSARDENDRLDLLEPVSAFTETTVDTLNTPIENEPQVDEAQQNTTGLSLLTHITSMREQDSHSPVSGASRSAGHSDRADAESVHLFLRNTTYDMDEDEAIAKGYRDFLPPPVPKIPEKPQTYRSSWTSSIAENSEGTPTREPFTMESEDTMGSDFDQNDVTDHARASLDPENIDANNEAAPNTAAGDTYTIVNIVIQEQSASGVVDQQLVDDIYQRILSEEPQIIEANILDEHRVVELCLRELGDSQASIWASEDHNEVAQEAQNHATPSGSHASDENDADDTEPASQNKPPPAPPKDLYPPPSLRKHAYKSSLDSAEDWAETSPSVVDWMQFALARGSDSENPNGPSPLIQATNLEPPDEIDQVQPVSTELTASRDDFTLQTASPPLRPPSHSPPPPPVHRMASIEQASMASSTSIQTILAEQPQIPHRVTSLSQIQTRHQPPRPFENIDDRPSSEADVEVESPQRRRLRQRRHVLKELVDTEFSYERDLRVLCDIYQQTAVAILSEDDLKILFGNVDIVQNFAKDFLMSLKQHAKPAYTMDRTDKRKELTRTPTSTSDAVSVRTDFSDLTDSEKDRQTKIGGAFEAAMEDMEDVYKEYIRGRHAANQRLAQLQSTPTVRDWLRECSENSTDITNAWSLDALLVKPIQRITKYPLLLRELLESTPVDHPDHNNLRQALTEVTDINIRINEVKKHTEIMDQVMNRKRKDSDVRAGLTKAFGRRAEKLRQHVGINDMYEDGEYARLAMDYDNNSIHLMLVTKDCQKYTDAVKNWVGKMVDFATVTESWLDVGHSNHAEAESKLRQLAMAVRGISSIALSDHTELVMHKVIQPMEKARVLMDRFKADPKGLITKREKKFIDYNQAKNKKDRGEKIDRKMTERMEQWEAINVETKERMRKLLSATTVLVQSCLAQLVQLHMAWLAMVEQKFAAAMAIPIEGLEHVDLVKEWQVDFDFQHAFAMSLSICNGTLLAEAMNLMSFLTPGSTLNGEESPHQSSWTGGAKRSISMNSEGSPAPDSGPRFSGQQGSQTDYPPEGSSFGQNSARNRATSMASGRTPYTPDTSGRSTGLGAPMPSGHFSRPGTSPGRSDDGSMRAPRVSLDAPSPSLNAFRSASPARPGSASTFFSAAPGPSNHASQPASGGSSIFSSAMPLSDSPETERYPGFGAGEEEPQVLFTAASVYEFNIDRARQEGGIPYLTYVGGEIFDIIGERGELWLARNQDDGSRQVGWIWNKHFAKLAA